MRPWKIPVLGRLPLGGGSFNWATALRPWKIPSDLEEFKQLKLLQLLRRRREDAGGEGP